MAEDTQTTHEGSGWKTKFDQTITIPRGSDQTISFKHGSLSSEISRIVFTARKTSSTEDGLGTVVIQIASDTHSAQWTTTTNYEADLSFLDTDTQLLRAADSETNLIYDLELYLNDTTYYMVERGAGVIEYDVSHDDSTTPYPNWDTLEDYGELLDQYVAGFDRTFLSADASGSDTDIDVDDASIFSASDDIRVILDDGTYTEVTIDTISTNNIDFSTSDPGGLDSAASENNVVLKVV